MALSNEEKQAELEIRAFCHFAQASPRDFDLETVEKKQEDRHPDILVTCSGEAVAVELVELIDQDFARRTKLMFDTRRMMPLALRELPEDKQ